MGFEDSLTNKLVEAILSKIEDLEIPLLKGAALAGIVVLIIWGLWLIVIGKNYALVWIILALFFCELLHWIGGGHRP